MEVRGLKYGLGGTIAWGAYPTGETAITIDDGEPVCVATVNLEEWGQPRAAADRVWLKTWAENEGVDRALVAAGVVQPFSPSDGDLEVFGGYGNGCRAVLMRLTPAALADLEASR